MCLRLRLRYLGSSLRLAPAAVPPAPPSPPSPPGWDDIGLGGDDVSEGVPLPFAFPFYCQKVLP